MKTEDFDKDNWEEMMFLESLDKILGHLDKKTNEESVLELIETTAIYLDNLCIRERGGFHDTVDTEDIFYHTSDRFGLLAAYLKHQLSNVKPLSTINRDKKIALFIDALVTRNSPKQKAITAIADWLGMGVETVDRISKQFCVVKAQRGKAKGQITKSKSFIFQADTLNELIQANRAFSEIDREVYSAFEILQKDIAEAEESWAKIRNKAKKG